MTGLLASCQGATSIGEPETIPPQGCIPTISREGGRRYSPSPSGSVPAGTDPTIFNEVTTMKSINDRLYTRNGRYYGNFSDLGGSRRKALIPPGERKGTEDFDLAYRLASEHVEALEQAAESGTSAGGRDEGMRWDAYARRHINHLILNGKAASTVGRIDQSLRWFRKFLVERDLGDILLSEIDPSLVADFHLWRGGHPGTKPGTTLSPETRLNDLYSVSGMLRRACNEGHIAQNPVTRVEKPKRPKSPTTYLEIIEGAMLLLVAGWFDLFPSPRSFPFLEPLIATMLIQGLRLSEASGLYIEDVDLERGVLRVWDNPTRDLKTPGSFRSIPIWPQYREIIEPHIRRRREEGGRLLFPGSEGESPKDIRGSLKTLVEAAGIEKHVTPHTLRHTYASVRIQTLDHGEPVALFTVAQELGHRSIKLLEERYAHLLIDRRRLGYVEYRFPKANEHPET